MRRLFTFLLTHSFALLLGFALGIYALPILTAPNSPDRATILAGTANALFTGRFDRHLKGSDLIHWGEGEVRLTRERIAHEGRLAPGPDYKLYLATEFVDSKPDFLRIKEQARLIGDVKTFDGFLLDVPAGIDVTAHTTVVVWCEAFSQFISAARYR